MVQGTSQRDVTMVITGTKIVMDIAGPGIIFHSPTFTNHIAEGEDYLSENYTTEDQVQAHIQIGTIVGFGTGTPGTFVLRFCDGYPNDALLSTCQCKLRLGLHCSGGLICFRDLYELMNWRAHCSSDRTLQLEDGFYHVTLCSNPPASGVLGDNQDVLFYLQKLSDFPSLRNEGIPMLCIE
jgi:hypothetical protein